MKIKTLVVVCILTNMLSAQDLLHFCNGNKDTVIVLEVYPDEIVYKKYNYQNGPKYRVPKTAIDNIVYAGGRIEQLNNCYVQTKKYIDSNYAAKQGRNLINLNTLGFLIRSIDMGYERILGNGRWGLKFNLSCNVWGSVYDFGPYEKQYASRVDINYYPAKQGKVRYYIGPSIRASRGFISKKGYSPYRPDEKYNFVGFMINNGFTAMLSNHVYMGINFGWGYKTGIELNRRTKEEGVEGIIGFNLGSRF